MTRDKDFEYHWMTRLRATSQRESFQHNEYGRDMAQAFCAHNVEKWNIKAMKTLFGWGSMLMLHPDFITDEEIDYFNFHLMIPANPPRPELGTGQKLVLATGLPRDDANQFYGLLPLNRPLHYDLNFVVADFSRALLGPSTLSLDLYLLQGTIYWYEHFYRSPGKN